MTLESALEAYFHAQVRRRLLGRAVKVAPIDKGTPDRLVLLPGGRLYLVELKRERGKVAPLQRIWHERAAQLGTLVHVVAGRAGIDAWVAQRLERAEAEMMTNPAAEHETCRGTTPAGRGCRRATNHASGLCPHHRRTTEKESTTA